MKVRDIIRLVEADGWALVATRGSHRQYKHRTKLGRVTIAGHPSDDLAPVLLTAFSSRPNSREALMRYAVVIEQADGNYSAYVPDLPGCIATGATIEAVEAEIRDAIRFHIEGIEADGLPVPPPTTIADYVDA